LYGFRGGSHSQTYVNRSVLVDVDYDAVLAVSSKARRLGESGLVDCSTHAEESFPALQRQPEMAWKLAGGHLAISPFRGQ